MEKGDPGVGMGIYAVAICLMGRTQALSAVVMQRFWSVKAIEDKLAAGLRH